MASVDRNGRPGVNAVQSAADIFKEYGGFIRTAIRFQAHGKFDEDDLYQEFFLVLIRKPVPAEVQNIKSYLYRAIVSHVVDFARMREYYHHAVKKIVRETQNSIYIRLPTNAFIEEQEERDATIAHYARRLQGREAQALVLKYRDNCSNGEIAAKMGVNAGTVSRYLYVGLKRLRKALAP